MSVSAVGISRMAVLHQLPRSSIGVPVGRSRKTLPTPSSGGLVTIECSSRPKKKATAHHMKTRPKKTQPWDILRGPTVYPPLPPLPPDWTLASEETAAPAAQSPSESVANSE